MNNKAKFEQVLTRLKQLSLPVSTYNEVTGIIILKPTPTTNVVYNVYEDKWEYKGVKGVGFKNMLSSLLGAVYE